MQRTRLFLGFGCALLATFVGFKALCGKDFPQTKASGNPQPEKGYSSASRPTASAEEHPAPAGPETPRTASAAPRPLFTRVGTVTGQKLARAILFGPGGDLKPEGQRVNIDPISLTALTRVATGESISLPTPEGEIGGTVNLVQDEETGWRSVAGTLDGGGTFSFGIKGGEAGGTLLLPSQRRAYQLRMEGGRPVFVERRLADLVCLPLPRVIDADAAATPDGSAPVAAAGAAAVPILSSRPNATAVLFLDFDGATVTDPVWNGGRTIVAPASTLSASAITETWSRVKEDYWPFNIDVTTDPSRYNSAPVGKRMRCIITSNDDAAPGAGGVAWIGSFDRAGQSGYGSSTVPCWAYNQGSPKVCADTISHEIGHTLGLYHDGNSNATSNGDREYYAGQGSGSTSWGPIMGAPYNKVLTQWSKGEYAGANNHEDDVAIIANTANGFGYVADEAGGTFATANKITRSGSTAVSQDGIITRAGDVDVYKFTAGGPATATLTATPATTGPNADLQLELLASNGTSLASSNPADALNATVSSAITAGTYYVRITGVGKGAATGTGYSTYGSIGAYRITGTLPAEGFDLGTAFNAENQNWSTTGQPAWEAQKTTSHDGQGAAQVSNTAAGERADLSTTVSGPLDLSFWWKVSSKPTTDFLAVLVDGAEKLRISGEQDWTQATLALGVGSHSITWRYQRQSSGAAGGQNSAWLDNVTFAPIAAASGADQLAAATPILGRIFRITTDNSSASMEAGEPQPAGQINGRSLWWKWTAPASGVVSVSTSGSSIPTVVTIYQQKAETAVGSYADLAPLASMGSTDRAPQATARFTAEAGRTYAITVAGAYGAAGPIRLTLAYASATTFAGLLTPPASRVAPGLITFTITRDLRFTCQARVGSSLRTYKGELAATGPADAPQLFGQALTILSGQATGSEHLTGTLLVDGRTYLYTAAAALPPAELSTASFNLAAGSAEFSPTIPGGLTYAHLDLKNGRIKAVGVAGDGSKFSAASVLTVDQSWPLYAQSSQLGALTGEVFFDDENRELSGQLAWLRSANYRRASYPDLIDLKMDLRGSRYESYQQIFAASSARVTFESDPSVAMPGDRTITLTAQGQASRMPGISFSLQFIGKTGLFRGTTINPLTGRRVAFGGATLDLFNYAGGVIALPTGSGQVTLTP